MYMRAAYHTDRLAQSDENIKISEVRKNVIYEKLGDFFYSRLLPPLWSFCLTSFYFFNCLIQSLYFFFHSSSLQRSLLLFLQPHLSLTLILHLCPFFSTFFSTSTSFLPPFSVLIFLRRLFNPRQLPAWRSVYLEKEKVKMKEKESQRVIEKKKEKEEMGLKLSIYQNWKTEETSHVRTYHRLIKIQHQIYCFYLKIKPTPFYFLYRIFFHFTFFSVSALYFYIFLIFIFFRAPITSFRTIECWPEKFKKFKKAKFDSPGAGREKNKKSW